MDILIGAALAITFVVFKICEWQDKAQDRKAQERKILQARLSGQSLDDMIWEACGLPEYKGTRIQ